MSTHDAATGDVGETSMSGDEPATAGSEDLGDTGADHAEKGSGSQASAPVNEPTPTANEPPSWRRRVGPRWPLIVAGSLAALSVVVAATLFFTERLPDQRTDASAKEAALSAASEGTVAVLSYAPDSVDQDLQDAKSHLTGDFLDYYTKFADQFLEPAAKEKEITSKASVVRAAVSELDPGSATVLVFVNQVTQSKDNALPDERPVSVIVKLTRSDGRWLISAFDPV